MKITLSIPEETLESVRRLAERLGLSQTDLLHRALGEYLARHDPDLPADGVDPFVQMAARAVLRRTEW